MITLYRTCLYALSVKKFLIFFYSTLKNLCNSLLYQLLGVLKNFLNFLLPSLFLCTLKSNFTFKSYLYRQIWYRLLLKDIKK